MRRELVLFIFVILFSQNLWAYDLTAKNDGGDGRNLDVTLYWKEHKKSYYITVKDRNNGQLIYVDGHNRSEKFHIDVSGNDGEVTLFGDRSGRDAGNVNVTYEKGLKDVLIVNRKGGSKGHVIFSMSQHFKGQNGHVTYKELDDCVACDSDTLQGSLPYINEEFFEISKKLQRKTKVEVSMGMFCPMSLVKSYMIQYEINLQTAASICAEEWINRYEKDPDVVCSTVRVQAIADKNAVSVENAHKSCLKFFTKIWIRRDEKRSRKPF
ncbi:MAG: hypothetical protein KAQ98_12390 [Bacteriovoracaceae bacterium]|nr:hypothetical protein [Bacteriovoracaceae bacterium]